MALATPALDPLTSSSADFFAALSPLENPSQAFDPTRYRPAPDEWGLAVTDIVDSTRAVADGRHKTVNFVAAMGIAAAKNVCMPRPIPFLFGGDGAVFMVPAEQVVPTRVALARVRGTARRDHGLELRAGLVPVSELRRHGCDVRVARYEPSPGNSFGVFDGGGVGVLDDVLRGRGPAALAALAAVPEGLDDGVAPDLTGLSCRWAPLRSRQGKMVSLIVHGAARAGAVHEEVIRIAGRSGDPRPVRLDNLEARWPPEAFMLEARARARGRWTAAWALRVLAETLVARVFIARGKPVAGFDIERYRSEITTNTDFCRHDRTLCFVVDCAEADVEALRDCVARHAREQGFAWGMHVSDTATMTCLVTSDGEGRHVHFVDGGGGGYTKAAQQMKAARAPGDS
jgi:hypothetical protein